ncbi:hypothetical protein MASR2M47_27560 [Draconibacterium sp.]
MNQKNHNLSRTGGSSDNIPDLRFPEFANEGEWVEEFLIDTADKKVKWSFTGGPFGSNLKASDYTTKGIRIIQLQNIGDGEFNDNYKIYTSEEKADELVSCNIYSGEIILSKMGDPVGRACIIPDNIIRCVMASDGIRLVIDEKKYSKYFIFSLINSKQTREAIEKKATGSTRKRIGLDELRSIELITSHSFKNCLPKYILYVFQNIDWRKHNEAGGVPSLSKTNIYKIEVRIPKPQEQQKIASCLSSLDELLAAHNQKLETLKDHKKGLMQNLFPNCLNYDFRDEMITVIDKHPNDKKSTNQVNQKNQTNQSSDKVPKYRFPEFVNDGEWVEKKLGDKV